MQDDKFVILICGSRSITDKVKVLEFLKDQISSFYKPKLRIISGGAKGVDQLAEQFAEKEGIECIVHPANWRKYGPGAGYVRNAHMVSLADYVIALWDGKSKGTANTIMLGHKKGIPVEVRLLETVLPPKEE